jgi:hypothetical protein
MKKAPFRGFVLNGFQFIKYRKRRGQARGNSLVHSSGI